MSVFTCKLHVVSMYSAGVCRNSDVVYLSAVLVLWCLHRGFAFLCFLCSRQYRHVCVSAKEGDFDLTAKLTTASEWCQREAKEAPVSAGLCVYWS